MTRWTRVGGSMFVGIAALALAACGTDPDPTEEPGDEVTCGAGTEMRDGMCVAVGVLTCGSGTHEEDGACVTDRGARYELRIFGPEIAADGHSKTPVLVIGTKEDGTPATDQVVLNIDRPGAGRFLEPAPTVGPLGTIAHYEPCNATVPGCVGPLALTLALASAPTAIIARLDVMLVEPDGVATVAPCMVAPRTMYFDGNDFIYHGMLTVTDAVWSAVGSKTSLSIGLTPSVDGQGLWWDLDFHSQQLGSDLVPGVYEMAQRAPFAAPGHPGLEVTGDGRGCNTIAGRFEVHTFELDGGAVKRALVSFEQHCEGGAAMVAGCVRYER
jgi:hypothetical protein